MQHAGIEMAVVVAVYNNGAYQLLPLPLLIACTLLLILLNSLKYFPTAILDYICNICDECLEFVPLHI